MKIEIKNENEIYVDDVKYIKEIEKNNKKTDDVIQFSNLDWFIISQDEESYTLILKNRMTPEMIQKHFTQQGMVDSDYDVRYSFTNNNDWKESYIRLVLNTSFIYDLDRDKMLKMNDDYVRLITKEEVENMNDRIRKVNEQYGYWTMTPYSGDSSDVWGVYADGSVSYWSAGIAYGVRPVIKIKRGNL